VVLAFLWRDTIVEFFVGDTPSRDSIYRLVKELEETGNVSDGRGKERKRRAPVRPEEAVGAAREVTTESRRRVVQR
jgi:hypothetical protein